MGKYEFDIIDGIDGLSDGKPCFRYTKEDFVIAEISAVSWERASQQGTHEVEEGYKLLQLMDCHFLLLIWTQQEEIQLIFFSDNRRVRALEFLDAMLSEYGLVKGGVFCAKAQISSAILQVQMSGMDLNDKMDYFLKMGSAYFEETDWIDAVQYAKEHKKEILSFHRYRKKRKAWAYVKTTDVVEKGQQIWIKSLENESGMKITAADDMYIMIGCRGEIYFIKKEVFERTYEKTEEPLDIFGQMLEFLPEIETVPKGGYISIDEIAHLCYPLQGNGIYACPIDKRTKIFPADGSMEYFLGRPGDYMAIRVDDLSDIYIIQREIFGQTYEIAE